MSKKIFLVIFTFLFVINLSKGQTAYDTIDVSLDYIEPLITIPNAFTPNGDGLNDYFYPFIYYNYPIVKYELRIFSINGQQVFYTTDPYARWGGDQPDMATIHNYSKSFVYYLYVQFSNGVSKKLRGSFLLLII
jgi:hypothetical protein